MATTLLTLVRAARLAAALAHHPLVARHVTVIMLCRPMGRALPDVQLPIASGVLLLRHASLTARLASIPTPLFLHVSTAQLDAVLATIRTALLARMSIC
jgi:hypothetical protein